MLYDDIIAKYQLLFKVYFERKKTIDLYNIFINDKFILFIE